MRAQRIDFVLSFTCNYLLLRTAQLMKTYRRTPYKMVTSMFRPVQLSVSFARFSAELQSVHVEKHQRNYPGLYFCSDSAVGIATRYGLNDPGSNSGVGEIFRTRPDRSWGPPTLLYDGYRVFPGGKAAGAWC